MLLRLSGIGALSMGLWLSLASAKVSAEEPSMKTFIRAVSSGNLKVDDLGELTPYFSSFQSIATYEDKDVYLSLGRNQKKEIVIFAWLKGERQLSLDEATERWVEEKLAAVTTEGELAEWKEFRALLREPILSTREEAGPPVEAVAFVGDFALMGPGSADSQLQTQPAAFRFIKGPRKGEVLALNRTQPSMILASFQH